MILKRFHLFIKAAAIIAALALPRIAAAQSMVVEVNWNYMGVQDIKGLMVLYPDDSGKMKMQAASSFSARDLKAIETLNVVRSYDKDNKCTTYINGSFMGSRMYAGKKGLSFRIDPDGQMFTIDRDGAWVMPVDAEAIPKSKWEEKMKEYEVPFFEKPEK